MQPRKDRPEEADVVKTAAGNTLSAVRAWCQGSSGVSEQGMRTSEVHPGTWETLLSPFKHPGKENRVTNSPGLRVSRSAPEGANKRARDGTANRRQRRAAGGGTGRRSTAEYRRSRGPAPRDPVEGRRCRDMEPVRGQTVGTPIPEGVSTKLPAAQGSGLAITHLSSVAA